MGRRRRRAVPGGRIGPKVVATALVAALAGCAGSGDDDATSTLPGTTLTIAAPTTVTPTTVMPTTVTPATDPPGDTTPATDPVVVPPADAASGYPAQPAGVPFPDGEWPTAALPPGVDQAAIDAAVETAMGAPDASSGVRSVVVVQGGAIVYERYHPSVGPDTVMASYSVAKSFTSAIVGLLVDDGLLALDEHPPRPEWPAGDPRAAITLRQLLQMSSGLEWDEVQSLMTMGLTMLSSPSAAAIMAQQPLERAPGSAFEYSTGTSALVAGIAADALGGCAALDAYVHERLLDPIGISTAAITTDGGGCFVGGLGMDMTARDFARFGLLHARGGTWDGRQVLSTDWIDEARVPAATNAQYGLHWWLGPTGQGLAAVGLGGQQIAVFPGSDLVVVVNSTLGNDAPAATLVGQVAAAFGAVS
jgi:CubicO group peptidase (beta-lactamase class C family)